MNFTGSFCPPQKASQCGFPSRALLGGVEQLMVAVLVAVMTVS